MKVATEAPVEDNFNAWPLEDLMVHLEETHHTYTRESLSRIGDLVGQVADTPEGDEPNLRKLALLLTGLNNQLREHMRKEEEILFPAVRDLLVHDCPGECAPMVTGPLMCMELEHEEAEDTLTTARELTNNYTAPPRAPKVLRELFKMLSALDADLQQHVHKENDIFFPRVRAYAGDVCEAGD